MTFQECEQLQEDIITYCDGKPQELIDNLCQAIIDYYQAHRS